MPSRSSLVSPFVTTQLMVGAALVALAPLPLAIGSRTGPGREHFLFSIVAILAAAEASCAPWRYHAATTSQLLLAIKFASSFQALLGLVLVWFVALYAGLRPTWIPSALTLYGTLVTILYLTLPSALLFNRMPVLREVSLPWGERIVQPIGSNIPWFVFASAFEVLMISYMFWGCVSLWRQQIRKAKAMCLAIGLAPVVLVAYPHGLLVNWGVLPPPNLYSFAFLAFVMVMSLGLVRESAQTARLAHDKVANERRWQSFFENLNLLVVGEDSRGRLNYLNPFFLKVSGYTESELIGQNFSTIVPSCGEHRISEGAFAETAPAREQANFTTKAGAKRKVIWSHLSLGDSEAPISGTLNVGVDVTDRLKAEADRDEALQELHKLRAKLEAENVYLKEEVETTVGSPHIIGESGSIRYVLRKIQQVSKTEATVLIEGETGAGKELVARAVHKESLRSKGPFIRVNCAALPPTIVESELFGHEKGAFTGADRLRKGRFELAEGGTLFLDEVGELSLEIQAKLLRVLQEGEFERVGGSRTLKADVRVLAATNRNLRVDVSCGRFREDLYYRLQVFPISVPPLRARREDIPLLVKHFARLLAVKHGKPISEVPAGVIAALMEWDWPGNIRELANVVELAVITSKGERLTLPSEFRFAHSTLPETEGHQLVSLAKMERQYILRVLERTNWKVGGKGGAAEILELHPNTLRTRMEKLGITRNARRSSDTPSTESSS